MTAAVVTAVTGTVAAVVRNGYFKTAVDGEGFLIPWHPMQLLFWILAGIVLVLAGLLTMKMPKFRPEVPADMEAGFAQLLLGVCLGLTAFRLPDGLRFYFILKILGFAAGAVFLLDGVFRCMGKKLGIVPYSLFCIFLLLYSIDLYAQWSNVPEMERILVPALGQILLVPLACEKAIQDSGAGDGKALLVLSMAAGFFCIAAIGCPGVQLLHLGGVVLSVSTLLSLRKEGV